MNNNKYFGPITTFPEIDPSYLSDSPLPLTEVSRSYDIVPDTARIFSFANGTDVPTGKYRILVRRVKPFGTVKNVEDWELVLSSPVKIVYPLDSSSNSNSSTSNASEASGNYKKRISNLQTEVAEYTTLVSSYVTPSSISLKA